MRGFLSKAGFGLMLAGLWVAGAADRKNPPQHPASAAEKAPPPSAHNPQPKNQPVPKLNSRNPGTALDRWNAMSPSQREKALAKLPPERQKEIRDRIQRFNEQFNQLPKQEQQMLREKVERLNKLPPREQQAVRKDIRNFNQLPPDRKKVLYKELDKVHKMPDNQRSAYLSSDEFRNKYSPDEQQMVQNLAKILPSPPE